MIVELKKITCANVTDDMEREMRVQLQMNEKSKV